MLNLFGNGLRGHEHPSFGGRGGRADRTVDEGWDTWSTPPSLDRAPEGSTPDEYSMTRWFGDAQRDFVTRLRWSATPEYADGNHHPVVTVTPGLDRTASPGSSVALAASATDPDGDEVTYRWWQYVE